MSGLSGAADASRRTNGSARPAVVADTFRCRLERSSGRRAGEEDEDACKSLIDRTRSAILPARGLGFGRPGCDGTGWASEGVTAVYGEMPADGFGMLLASVLEVCETSGDLGGVDDLFGLANDGKARSIDRHRCS